VTADDLPDWAIRGRSIEPEWRKKRAARRARRFVMVSWEDLTVVARTLGMDRASRLFFLLCLRNKLTRTRSADGWIELALHDLAALDLADRNLGRVVARLERVGLVEVQRRSGKRPLLRLVPRS
jgi:hypothetical protein